MKRKLEDRMMKRFGFSQGVKQQMRKQISNVLLITILILIISIGMFVQKSIFYGRLLFVVFLAGIAITVFTVRKVRNIDSLYYVAADCKCGSGCKINDALSNFQIQSF